LAAWRGERVRLRSALADCVVPVAAAADRATERPRD
jgi:hypothetical protein